MINIENWKLKEIAGKFEIIANDSSEYVENILLKLKLPLVETYVPNRSQTEIDWEKMSYNYSFFTDDKDEMLIRDAFGKSSLVHSKYLILTYGWEEPVIKMPSQLFLEDWEGFIRSKKWEGFIFSEDFSLIIECTRDYYLHSNFLIWPNSLII